MHAFQTPKFSNRDKQNPSLEKGTATAKVIGL